MYRHSFKDTEELTKQSAVNEAGTGTCGGSAHHSGIAGAGGALEDASDCGDEGDFAEEVARHEDVDDSPVDLSASVSTVEEVHRRAD